jgi:hypothetical protein
VTKLRCGGQQGIADRDDCSPHRCAAPHRRRGVRRRPWARSPPIGIAGGAMGAEPARMASASSNVAPTAHPQRACRRHPGMASPKVSKHLTERHLGVTATTRNWNNRAAAGRLDRVTKQQTTWRGVSGRLGSWPRPPLQQGQPHHDRGDHPVASTVAFTLAARETGVGRTEGGPVAAGAHRRVTGWPRTYPARGRRDLCCWGCVRSSSTPARMWSPGAPRSTRRVAAGGARGFDRRRSCVHARTRARVRALGHTVQQLCGSPGMNVAGWDRPVIAEAL